MHLYIKI